MKKKSFITIMLCALLCVSFGIVAFAGDYDTPVIPIHTRHTYSSSITTPATCTQDGVRTYTCTYPTCSKSYTEAIPAKGHLFSFSGNQTEQGIELECPYCDGKEYKSAEELEKLWDEQFINCSPNRTGTDNSGYLDLDSNCIINAKDYATIINLEQKELNNDD